MKRKKLTNEEIEQRLNDLYSRTFTSKIRLDAHDFWIHSNEKRIESLEAKSGNVTTEFFKHTGDGDFPFTTLGFKITKEPAPKPLCVDRNSTDLFEGDWVTYWDEAICVGIGCVVGVTNGVPLAKLIVVDVAGEQCKWWGNCVTLYKRKAVE